MTAIEQYRCDNKGFSRELTAWLEHVASQNGTLWLKRDFVLVAVPFDVLAQHCEFNKLVDWDKRRAKGGLYVHYAAGDVKRMLALGRKSGWRKIIYHRALSGRREMKVMMFKGGAK